ncbi:DUF3871 family protein [Daejeonella oryzae]|uniref:DUF3871 family protein n=1 Tax=Daejeonella oryzae TaxID=1122943 RepID=UPI0004187D0B|nr:DUF3871 family protein [Daejeonella oryzae]
MENTIIRLDQVQTNPSVKGQPISSFITANTTWCAIEELRHIHHIPVFVKDNEPVISQVDFIDTTVNLISDLFYGETISTPQIRCSHPIKGRIAEAKHKSANELEEREKTIYYERMAFVVEIPSITEKINGNLLSLTVGGVKAYNLDNLYNRKGADESFKVFIGFQNKVCTNMCVWSDGFIGDLKVKNRQQLKASIGMLIQSYSAAEHLKNLKQLCDHSLTEQQFAQLVGRCRMYQHLPKSYREKLVSDTLAMTDTQIGAVVKDFYHDLDFGGDQYNTISLWNLYNLFTGVNKTTYIDNFLDRSVNAYQFVKNLQYGLENKYSNWFLN